MAAGDVLNEVNKRLYRGRMKPINAEGITRMLQEGVDRAWSSEHLAYALATAYHETGKWMQPIREGGFRTGPGYSDASAKRAVASIHAKGIIRRNYALPAGPFGQSYYGRGLVQITWYDNYLKLGERLGLGTKLAENPDLALDMDIAVKLLFIGMEEGLYTGRSLGDYTLPAQFKDARRIINGDVRKNGQMIADEAAHFLAALSRGS